MKNRSKSASTTTSTKKDNGVDRLSIFLERIVEERGKEDNKPDTSTSDSSACDKQHIKKLCRKLLYTAFEQDPKFSHVFDKPTLKKKAFYPVGNETFECRVFLKRFTHPDTCFVSDYFLIL